MKSEPNEFSIDDLKRVDTEPWDGIRNYQVRNMFRDNFAVGDRAFFYHSNTKEIGIVGEMEVVSEAYPDPTQFDANNSHFDPKSTTDNPRWLLVDVQFVKKFPRTITLQELKNDPAFTDLTLVKKGNRLSVMPITKQHYQQLKNLVKL
jgi:predicted RNA-binding protein with PUA-like domain